VTTTVELAVPDIAQSPVPVIRSVEKHSASRLVVLDLLRFLAALLVVSSHWLLGEAAVRGWREGMHDHTGGLPLPLIHASGYGWMGVELFFLISGFVICMSSWGNTVAGFAKSRLARLMPAYWFSIVVILVLSRFPSAGVGASPGGVVSRAMVNATMFEPAYGVSMMTGAYWTLWAELWFYLVFAGVVHFGVNYRRVLCFCSLWMVASVVAAGADDAALSMVVQPTTAPYFISGICFYLMYRSGPNLILWMLITANFFLAQFEVIDQGARAVWGAGLKYSWPTGTVILAAFYVLMALVALGKLNFAKWRGFTVLGALTYPLYLLHSEVGFAVFDRLGGRFGQLVLAPATLACLLVVCWLVHRWVERPGSRWIKRGFDSALLSIRTAAQGTPAPSDTAS
jgi:peptidoglycan/LPS O-acetylase OafA/YrhL